MELTEHLGELRTRIIRSLWYLLVGAIVAYQFFTPLYGFLYKPMEQEMKQQNLARLHEVNPTLLPLPHVTGATVSAADYNKLIDAVNQLIQHPSIAPVMSIVFHNFHEAFMVRLQIGVLGGFILVLPLVIWELAGFITPALTPEERRPLRILIPLSIALLIFGIYIAYETLFFAIHWFLSYLADFPQPAVLMQNANDYVLFCVKMMAAFGIAFQLPVVLMALAFTGLVTSKGMLKNWRWGFVIAVMGGIFTPSNDLPSMALMSGPLLLLYFLSVFLVRYVEKTKPKNPYSPASS